MLTSIIVTDKSKDSDSGTYLRVEGMQLLLANQIDGQNLNAISFNLGKDNKNLIKLIKAEKNLIKVF